MNYKVFFGNNEDRKNYVLEGLIKETSFKTTDTDVPLLNLKGDPLIQNLYYDDEINEISYYGIQFSRKELEELSPEKFVKKMKKIKPKKEIRWSKVPKGIEILVKSEGDEEWWKRRILIAYDKELKRPFVVKNGDSVESYPKAKLKE